MILLILSRATEIIADRQKGEKMQDMGNKENARLILALRERGWNDTEINDLVLYMETGEEKWFDKVTKKEKAE